MIETSVLLSSDHGGGSINVGGAGGSASNPSAVAALSDGEGKVGGLGSDAIEDEKVVREAEEADRNLGVNRWPREETLALLKIRFDMDTAFRDSTLKAPLWDEVSRKMAEHEYNRSAKKCKEKFENIYKYHKRTKDGRSGRPSGKNYRFFEQLEVFESQSLNPPVLSLNKIRSSMSETTMAMPLVLATPMTAIKAANVAQDVTPTCSTQNTISDFMSTSTSTTYTSSKETEGRFKKKRKLADYFEKLMKQVLEKQESLQNKFLEAIEKCEMERTAREEAWKMQEMARIKKEQDMLAQDRAIAAAKDAAVIAFLQKISEQGLPARVLEMPIPASENVIEKQENSTISENTLQAGSSRWPKTEVEALIRIRTNFDLQYQDNGLKGSLWEEISSAMKKLGYDRSAKRCKEKWENINKYYRRVKDSNKRRPEDSKTCPYYHLLDSLYEMKSKKINNSNISAAGRMKPEDILMQMMGEQQSLEQEQLSVTEDGDGENVGQNPEEEEGDDDNDDNADDYQIVVNNSSLASSAME